MAPTDPSNTISPPPRVARNTAGIVFLLFMVAGAISVTWSFAKGTIGQDVQWQTTGLMHGELAQSLTAELGHASVPVGLAGAERAVSWLLAGSLGPRVRQGCGSWLFLVDELVVHPNAVSNLRARQDAVVAVRDHLRRHGIELVAAIVPDKSRIQHAQLCGVYRPVSFHDRLSVWEAGLADEGVRYVSLLPVLEALERSQSVEPFLMSDTHWSESGAQASATAVATAVRQSGVALTPHRRYVAHRGAPEIREGDLVRLAGIDWLPLFLQPLPDKVSPVSFSIEEPATTGSDMPPSGTADPAADLFGDINLPSAVLIGTSYSRTSYFGPFLEAALETPVPNFAQDGGDFWRAAKTYMSATEFRDTPPEVVIWEIPERVLEMPIGSEEQIWMQGLKTAPTH